MKIKNIIIHNFKRFSDLEIIDIPEQTRLVLLVGPNGSGKSSLLEAFNHWYRYKGFTQTGEKDYLEKKGAISEGNYWYDNKVQIGFHDVEEITKDEIKGKFYFRTAYRNEPDFKISELKNQNNPTENPKLAKLNINDVTVSENYHRLISQTLEGVFNYKNDSKSVQQFRDEIIGNIRDSLQRIFEDLNLSSIGDPLSDGSFYFEKGNAKDFHYKNLSAGEKSVFDLVLDLIIKTKYFPEAIFCIDEPEAHMHTRLQAKLLKELVRLLPEKSQLWISTHSIGMLNQAEEIEKENPSSVVFLNFDNLDFDVSQIIKPSKINKSIWDKFFELALADFSKLIAPETLVFCEGASQGRKIKDFDAQVFSNIFEDKYPLTRFVSVGSCNEIENIENQSINIVSSILKSSKIIKVVDRDGKSEREIEELATMGIKTLKRRHIESYLLDDEIIGLLCDSKWENEKLDECLLAKQTAIKASIKRKNPSDDIKSASGEIVVALKRILDIKDGGNNTNSFLRDTMCPLVTEKTKTFKELELEVFH